MTAALRLRLSHALAGATLEPAGMPPSAILIVRRLADPPPRRLTLSADPRSSLPWSRSARTALESHWRDACFPARDAVAANAASVAFADTSELLACAALAAAVGEGGVWWWRTLLHGRALDAAALAELWRERAAAVPAACALLVRSGRASRALTVLTSRQAIGILVRVAAAYEVDATALASGPTDPELVLRSRRHDLAPWTTWAPETSTVDLPSVHGALLGTALALYRAPTAARTALGARLVEWWQGTAREPRAGGDDASSTAPVLRIHGAGARAAAATDAVTGPTAPERMTEVAGIDTTPSVLQELHLTLGDAAAGNDGVTTALGGVVFLARVVRALRLDALPTAEAPWGAWGWVELLGRSLSGESFAGHVADPVWAVLAQLDGRTPGSPVGPPLPHGTERGIPAGWLRRLGEGASIVPVGGHRCAALAVTMARRRIAGALGLPTSVAHDDLTRILLRRNATIIVTGANVDVMFALRDARADVRMAGLDADPGWQPAFGRVIRFHYLDAADS